MSEHKPNPIVSSLKVAALVIGVFGALGAWAIIPYRLEQAEKAILKNNELAWRAISEIKEKRDVDHEILVRIDERLKRMEQLTAKK